MRNILAHQYLGVSIEATWAVVEKDLQPLKLVIIQIAATFGIKL